MMWITLRRTKQELNEERAFMYNALDDIEGILYIHLQLILFCSKLIKKELQQTILMKS